MITINEISALDRRFADFLVQEARGGDTAILWLVAAMVSQAAGNGDVCLDLEQIADREIALGKEQFLIPELAKLKRYLAATAVVGAPGEYRPLIMDNRRLYLYRYWKYERELARVILEKAEAADEKMDSELVKQGLNRLFPGATDKSPDWQKVAALAAMNKKLVVISGGPGTGKTSTVIKILALLLEQENNQPLKIALAAPTGKAAIRLQESIATMKEKLESSADIKELIPETVVTIHRLLGTITGSVRFRYSEKNPLPDDLVIVDEASMIALPLLAKLLLALKPSARIILIGDRNQLASVEAGAALGDICGGGRPEIFSPGFSKLCADLTGVGLTVAAQEELQYPLADALVILKENYRFSSESGIAAASKAINEGNGAEALAILKNRADADICWHAAPAPDSLRRALTGPVIDGYGAYLAAKTAAEALSLFEQFRFLCVLNRGIYGVEGINRLIGEILSENGLINPQQRWYRGRPVLITVNDYNLNLFNGDVGITFPDEEAGGKPCVYFPSSAGGLRKVSILRLPAHETVYAMTVHKSQGSEFDRIHLITPDADCAIMTRELIYTGITRARRQVDIWGKEEIIVKAISRKITRNSGLQEALWLLPVLR